jgi:hypothetical protein
VLHKSASDEQVARLFRAAAPGLEYVDVKRDRVTGRSKGYAYVNYSTAQSAQCAVRELNGAEFPPGSGCRLKVMPAEVLGGGAGSGSGVESSANGSRGSSGPGVQHQVLSSFDHAPAATAAGPVVASSASPAPTAGGGGAPLPLLLPRVPSAGSGSGGGAAGAGSGFNGTGTAGGLSPLSQHHHQLADGLRGLSLGEVGSEPAAAAADDGDGRGVPTAPPGTALQAERRAPGAGRPLARAPSPPEPLQQQEDGDGGGSAEAPAAAPSPPPPPEAEAQAAAAASSGGGGVGGGGPAGSAVARELLFHVVA